jgi:16S rRNA (guanine(966)-N(2))-methyltransferase RsmD
MRIISGEFKGRRIEPPSNISARPTTDFAKEGLFNVLNNLIDYEESNCLDLFSGTGAITLELASRGCPSILSVELNDKHLTFLKKTISDLKITTVFPIKADVFKFIPTTTQKFDLIFADPPYDLNNLEMIPDLVFKYSLLKENGLFVFEHSKKNDFSEHPHFLEHRHYGNVNFTFFK